MKKKYKAVVTCTKTVTVEATSEEEAKKLAENEVYKTHISSPEDWKTYQIEEL